MKTNLNVNQNYEWNRDQVNKKPGADKAKGILEERSGLSVDDFLQIMAAEMQNQSPMGDSGGGGGSKTDYVSQLAQFTSLELMTDLVESLNYVNVMSQQQYAFSLRGKEVSLKVGEETISGLVEKVKIKEGFPMISLGGEDYPLGNIMEVGELDES